MAEKFEIKGNIYYRYGESIVNEPCSVSNEATAEIYFKGFVEGVKRIANAVGVESFILSLFREGEETTRRRFKKVKGGCGQTSTSILEEY